MVEGSMDHLNDKAVEHLLEAAIRLCPEFFAKDLYDIEKYFREEGHSEFVYDEELEIFRFPDDGRFAFCREFADWERLRERGYLTF
jgi:hypothetical protein